MTARDHASDDLTALVSRRRVLLAGGAVAGVGVLAACGGSGSSATSSAASSAATSASAPAPTSAAATTSGSGGGGAVLGPVSQVPVGGGTVFASGSEKIVVTQPTAGVFEGFSAVCPHEGCNCNAVQDGLILCPCHGSAFAITDGAVQRGPARQGLAPVSVEVQGQDVVKA